MGGPSIHARTFETIEPLNLDRVIIESVVGVWEQDLCGDRNVAIQLCAWNPWLWEETLKVWSDP